LRNLLIRIAEVLTWISLLPFFLWRKVAFTESSGFTACGQILSLVPGTLGILLRRVWYRHTLARCGTNLTVEWLGVIRLSTSEVGNHVTIGVANWVSWVRLGNDVMMGSHIVLLSGGRQHGFEDVTKPMRLQHGEKRQLIIGDDVWIGAQTVILTDVSEGTVIGAGSVVTKTFPPRAVIAGTPARLIRMRENTKLRESQ
jgi:virginiamycin A acetyltransferase